MSHWYCPTCRAFDGPKTDERCDPCSDAGYERTVIALVPAHQVTRLRVVMERARDICEDAAEMQCSCTGYYRCGGCERRIAERADDAREVLVDALADGVCPRCDGGGWASASDDAPDEPVRCECPAGATP